MKICQITGSTESQTHTRNWKPFSDNLGASLSLPNIFKLGTHDIEFFLVDSVK
jgi:hypothetical protein